VTTELRIATDAGFSLAAAAGFGFGPVEAAAAEGDMRLAFVRDDLVGHAAVLLQQEADGTLHGELSGDGDPPAVERQVRRILSLDRDGASWLAVGQRDPVIGRLQATHPGLRPVLFHSPYEAAAWSVIAARRQRRQAMVIRRQLSEAHGAIFTLGGTQLAAFPVPAALQAVAEVRGLDATRVGRLRAVAEAALAGDLDVDRLRALDPNDARQAVQRLPGIGPFYANLIVIRALGHADLLPLDEPRLATAVGSLYDLRGAATTADLERIGEAWRPYRTWASVLIRVAADRGELG
jgi:DNA-3-methyladenine glycosylase II